MIIPEGYDTTTGKFDSYDNYLHWKESGFPEIPKPFFLTPCFENIPEELRKLKQWVMWSYVIKDGDGKKTDDGVKIWTKPPLNANGKFCDFTKPENLMTFEKVVELYESRRFDGIGFAFKKDGYLTAFDFDNVVNDGVLEKPASLIVDIAKSYTEYSVSGRGLHTIVKADIKGGRRSEKDKVEIYGDSHYFTMTGKIPEFLDLYKIKENQELADLVFSEISSGNNKKSSAVRVEKSGKNVSFTSNTRIIISNEALIKKIKDCEKTKRLFEGNISDYYNDHSRADAAFLEKILYWNGGNIEQADEVMRLSGLYRAKWERLDYRNFTFNLILGNKK